MAKTAIAFRCLLLAALSDCSLSLQLEKPEKEKAKVFEEWLSALNDATKGGANKSIASKSDATKDVCQVPPRHKPRVFIHSVPKTGTSTIGAALDLLGYNDCPSRGLRKGESFDSILAANELVKDYKIGHVPWAVQKQVRQMLSQAKGDVDGMNKSRRYHKDGNYTDVAEGVLCNSYSDFPIGHATGMNLRLKMILWPNSTYIWIDRPFEDWHHSYIEHNKLHGMDELNDACTKEEMHDFIVRRRKELVELEKINPGSVIFLDINKMRWKPLLEGLPVKKDCTPPTPHIPEINTHAQAVEKVTSRQLMEFEDVIGQNADQVAPLPSTAAEAGTKMIAEVRDELKNEFERVLVEQSNRIGELEKKLAKYEKSPGEEVALVGFDSDTDLDVEQSLRLRKVCD